MRTHEAIVKQFGASALFRALCDRGVEISKTTPQRWADRNSIPPEFWPVIVDLGVSTLEELAAASEAKGLPAVAEARAQASAA